MAREKNFCVKTRRIQRGNPLSSRPRDERNSLYEHAFRAGGVEKHLHPCEKEISGRANEAWKEGWKIEKGRLVLKSVERDLLIAAFLRSATITRYLILFKRSRRRRSLKKGVLTAPLQISPDLSSPFQPWMERARSSETALNSPLPPSECGQFVEGKRAAKLTLSRLIKNLASHLPFFYFNSKKKGVGMDFSRFLFLSSILLFIRGNKGKSSWRGKLDREIARKRIGDERDSYRRYERGNENVGEMEIE